MLLDTHVLLWLLADDARLGPLARERLRGAGEVLASAAGLWELAIKAELGKVSVPDDLPTQVAAAGLRILSVSADHSWTVRRVTGLPHRDPFDRLLLAQAAVEAVPLLTADELILGAKVTPEVRRIDARR